MPAPLRLRVRAPLTAVVALLVALGCSSGDDGATDGSAARAASTSTASSAPVTAPDTDASSTATLSRTSTEGQADDGGDDRAVLAVERFERTFVDTSRETPQNGDAPARPERTLETTIWHPAPRAAGAPFPLVVFAHGLASDAAAYGAVLERVAAAGYVVAAPTFPLSSGRAGGGPQLGDYPRQPGDVSFVMGEVLRLAESGDGPLAGLVDTDQVAVAGHSLGAITVLALGYNSCCTDARVDAVVAVSGMQLPFDDGGWFGGDDIPLLLVHGDADATVPYTGSTGAFAAAGSPSYLLTLHGGGHIPFTERGGPALLEATLDFLDAYLKDDEEALAELRTEVGPPDVARLEAR